MMYEHRKQSRKVKKSNWCSNKDIWKKLTGSKGVSENLVKSYGRCGSSSSPLSFILARFLDTGVYFTITPLL